MKKLPSRHLRYALPLGTSLIMTFLVSGVATYMALGLVDGMVGRWMVSWMVAWAIAFPTMYYMMPVVRRLLTCVIDET